MNKTFHIWILLFVIVCFVYEVHGQYNCSATFQAHGCYRDTRKRALPNFMLTKRGSPNFWTNYMNVLPSFICDCAKEAKDKGYRFFGIQFYGECWGSKNFTSHPSHRPTRKCIDERFQKCPKDGSDRKCSGKKWANFVYILQEPTQPTTEKPQGTSPPPTKGCQDALGMENGAIPDAHIRASSEWDGNHAAIQGRLEFKAGGGKQGSWSARSNDLNQWLQVDLGNQHTQVTGVATQGRNAVSQWVTKYKLQYSPDGVNFYYYKDPGQSGTKELVGNTDQETVVYHKLSNAIKARYIRFRPTAWHGHISMRVEVYGCEVHVDACTSGPCKNGGSCTVIGDNKFSCDCTEGFFGDSCEKVDACTTTPCKNGGSCTVAGNNKFSCDCTKEFFGDSCEKVNRCISSPCQHGGRCDVTGDNTYRCRCTEGFYGVNCEKDCSSAMDIALAIDASGSVGVRSFQLVRTFLKKFTHHFDVNHTVHFACLHYDHKVYTDFFFKDEQFHDHANLDAKLQNMTYPSGATLTDRALWEVNKFFASGNGARDFRKVKRVAVVLTDGRAYGGKYRLIPPVINLKEKQHVNVIVPIGVGWQVSLEELEIMGGQRHYVLVDNFDELANALYEVMDLVCTW